MLRKPMTQGHNQDLKLEEVAMRAYSTIAQVYPICCASDEFYFFPQVVQADNDWRVWDDFSSSKILNIADSLDALQSELSSFPNDGLSLNDQVDLELLQQLLKTLRGQLIDVAPHRMQPTFHLTVLAAGLAEALESADAEAWEARVSGVRDFLLRASKCLDEVPTLFRQLGLNMLHDLTAWLQSLRANGYDIGDMLDSMDSFRTFLHSVPVMDNYRLDEKLLETLISEHLGCGMTVDSLMTVLQEELQEMNDFLCDAASSLVPGIHWTEAENQIPFVDAEGESLLQLYRRELDQMESHCRHVGIVPEDILSTALRVKPVPEALTAVRASDSYAATPGSPPRGGVFYVMEEGVKRAGQPGRTVEYRMTAAHEAWPGHHLLDFCRWKLEHSIRRPIESPLFYEGWACMAEELMARTGYFNEPWDRFLLARRRVERAARGMIDLGLQSNRMNFAQAVKTLIGVGYRLEKAEAVIPKYLLRPGYQVCYTLGLKQGLDLLNRYGKDDVGRFAQNVLRQGEIGFSNLENCFRQR